MEQSRFKNFLKNIKKGLIIGSSITVVLSIIITLLIIKKPWSKKGFNFDKNTVNIAVPADTKGFDVASESVTSSSYSHHVLSMIHDTLLHKNKDGNLESRLAWIPEKNGNELTFTLKDNIFFHNGKSLNTDDIIFTFKRAQNNKHKQFLEIQEIIKIDNKKFKVVLTDDNLWWDFKFCNFFRVLSEETIKNAGTNEADIQKALQVGAGPYKLVNYEKDDKLQFELFDSYYNKERIQNSPKKINFFVSKDDDTNLQKLETDEFDAINYPGMKIKDVRQKLGDKVKIVENDSVSCSYMYLNKKNTPLEIRKIISQTIDTDKIKQELDLQSQVLNSYLPSSLIGYNSNLKYNLDFESAKNCVNKLEPKKKKLKIAASKGPLTFQPKIIEQLKNVGFDVEFIQEDFNIVIPNMTKDNSDINILFLGENHEMYYGHKALVDYFFTNNNENNFCHINQDDLEQIENKLIKAQKTSNKEEYTNLVKEVSKYIHDQVYVIPLYTAPSYFITSKSIKQGFTTDAFSKLEFTDIRKEK
ncbi:peptide ABC transporter substrate-binding protein [Hydrangea phyllody phytoplasma]|uniref:Peptide ABC transporter substrate-binding protein n=3 Tax=16SrI (Aster yellows group) TaxID=3042590 RepID=A0ABQ5PTS2_9MOLU|nr:ABC transporter substrate-binding protein [Hydrangea phyllody phytoplasma]GFZ75337.1 peptide ABC transporter substrate-binding protein [Hydrangea phyllody phytoplasma]GLH61510.1 peptide ABC transporter substrate-binding protein [Rhus yellows phytoplasma]GLH61653.1 peptide ABC transporter substrate-binding protein [Hydrangea phyllody phytoplasma]